MFVSPCNLLGTVMYSVSTNRWTLSFSATPASKMKKKLLFCPPQSPRNFFGFDFRSYSSRKSAITCGGISEINKNQFPDVVFKSNRPVLVEFVDTWCGPCHLISLIIKWAAQRPESLITHAKMVQITGWCCYPRASATILQEEGKILVQTAIF